MVELCILQALPHLKLFFFFFFGNSTWSGLMARLRTPYQANRKEGAIVTTGSIRTCQGPGIAWLWNSIDLEVVAVDEPKVTEPDMWKVLARYHCCAFVAGGLIQPQPY